MRWDEEFGLFLRCFALVMVPTVVITIAVVVIVEVAEKINP